MKKRYLILAVYGVLVLISINILHAEGTKEVMPNNINGTGLIVSTIAAFPLGSVGNYLGCPAEKRIYFNIKDFTTENLYYGFRWNFLTRSGSTVPYTDVYMRIFDPSGTQVALLNLPSSGAGFINNYTEAINGPNIGGLAPAGYNPLVFTPTQNGDYWIEMYQSSDGGVTEIAGGESMLSPWFDMTVAQTDNTRYTGRVHCTLWAFSVYDPVTLQQSPFLSSDAPFYAYTADSVIAKVDFEVGFKPLSFVIAFNNYGVQNTSNWLNDRRSVNATSLPALSNGYLVFLNPPDPTLYPVSSIPLQPTLVNPIIAGCPPGPYNVRFNAPQPGDYYILLDLNGIPGYQGSSADRFFELISQPQGIISMVWDGLDGLGVPVPTNTSLPITFSFRKGRVNVPLYDVEMNINGFRFSGISPLSQPNAQLYWNDTLLTSIPGTGTNSNSTGIGYINDIVGQTSPGHAWNGDGNSAFAIPAPAVAGNDVDNNQYNDFGNARLINTWAWGIELYISQTIKLACVNISGTVWDDADNSAAGTFTNIKTGAESGTNASGAIYASLVDPITGTVLSSAAVNPDGTYLLSGCPINAIGLQIVISIIPGTFGVLAPGTNLPANWLATSPLNVVFDSGLTDSTGLDFGIEKRPDSDPQTYTISDPVLNSFLTLNGTGASNSPGPLSGSDLEDGVMGNSNTAVITQVPVGAELYYNGLLVTNNTTIPNYNPGNLQIKFTAAVPSTSFQYAFVDAAGKQDISPATYIIQWTWALATKLTSINASKHSQSIVLRWTTTNETNTISFVVERSTDGRNFIPIGKVNGNSQVIAAQHSFADNDIFSNVTRYYRLQMVDAGGAKMYSSTVIVPFSMRSALEVLPNPFKDRLSLKVKLSSSGNVFVRLMDNKGVQLRQLKFYGVGGNNTFQIMNLSNLPPSVYFLQVAWEDKMLVQKISNR